MLLHLLLAIFIGGSMGLLGHAKKQGKIEKPRVTKRFIYLGFLEEMIIGTVAAVLVVASSDTDSIFRVVFLSILAGYGGERIMQRVEFVRRAERQTELPVETNQEQESNKKNDVI
ncbi:DUF4257 domain-containing protein [Fredinandcohnia sp. QZ13]|uniref:DUF4257 domain-containing protein n=1 Tax=Fredinandcohnia sp. QZ13 TaxID=3073144 RepID=UPI0028533A83|nr:DUF4257 domain-containing protein [Fredinandcohnia sp. QZ13]MDR4886887.1 DUF4257 domain-containing protein [Fredinandcohnia sp. QZ13]